MFINNGDILIEQLKTVVWENYKEIKSGDFKDWYGRLNQIEKSVFNNKFEELN